VSEPIIDGRDGLSARVVMRGENVIKSLDNSVGMELHRGLMHLDMKGNGSEGGTEIGCSLLFDHTTMEFGQHVLQDDTFGYFIRIRDAKDRPLGHVPLDGHIRRLAMELDVRPSHARNLQVLFTDVPYEFPAECDISTRQWATLEDKLFRGNFVMLELYRASERTVAITSIMYFITI
jgi:hypothetical protein